MSFRRIGDELSAVIRDMFPHEADDIEMDYMTFYCARESERHPVEQSDIDTLGVSSVLWDQE